MAFSRFTTQARAVVTAAVETARRGNSPRITEEHLVLALLDQRDTTAARVLAEFELSRDEIAAAFAQVRRKGGLTESDTVALRELGIDVDAVVASVEEALGENALADQPRFRRSKHVPFSDEAKLVLGRSLREATSRKSKHLGDEHLLLSLLAGKGVAADLLADRGVTYGEVSERLTPAPPGRPR